MNIRFDKCISKQYYWFPKVDFYWGKKLIMINWLKLPVLLILEKMFYMI